MATIHPFGWVLSIQMEENGTGLMDIKWTHLSRMQWINQKPKIMFILSDNGLLTTPPPTPRADVEPWSPTRSWLTLTARTARPPPALCARGRWADRPGVTRAGSTSGDPVTGYDLITQNIKTSLIVMMLRNTTMMTRPSGSRPEISASRSTPRTLWLSTATKRMTLCLSLGTRMTSTCGLEYSNMWVTDPSFLFLAHFTLILFSECDQWVRQWVPLPV